MTTRLGLVARADDGGLGTISQEFARHLHPDAALVVDLGSGGRGVMRGERVTDHVGEWEYATNPIDPGAARWLAERSDVIYSAETFYGPELVKACRKHNVPLVLHAMPELYRDEGQDVTWVPTDWALDLMPRGTEVVPVPIARDRLPFQHRERVELLLSLDAPAMLDRDGAELTRLGATEKGLVTISPTVDYWDRTAVGDVLVMPRRYGGLSLPVQEAASRGMPLICLDVPPLNRLPFAVTVPAFVEIAGARMRGGRFDVFGCDPRDLAERVRHLIAVPEVVAELSHAAGAWAHERSWEKLLPLYWKKLGLGAGQSQVT